MKKLLFCLSLCIVSQCLFAQTNHNLDFRSQVHYPKACSNIWGYVDSLGNEYALVGTWEGVSIVNVSNPDSPKIIADIPSVSPGGGTLVWREIKTWNKHAYVTNEEDSGLLIIDLSHLPGGTISYHHYTSHNLKTAHALWIDEKGILYLFGYNTYANLPQEKRGVMLFDLKNNPDQPAYISEYQARYVHDGFVRGDTLWACEIFEGWVAVIDVSNKNLFKVITTQQTPSKFTHNVWPTSDNHYLFTTDETTNSYLTSYDVSDLANITPLDSVQSNPGSGSIVHNVHILNDSFAVCSYYRDGVAIFDVTHPDNMIEVGNYDTSPLSGDGSDGDWGVYPYLPSQTIVVSDIQNGLFVFIPHYVHACWLQGIVRDSTNSALLDNVNVKILPKVNANNVFTDLTGLYKTGKADSGLYNIQFSKYGYITKVIHNVKLQNGITTLLNVLLVPAVSFSVSVTIVDSLNQPIAASQFFITDNINYTNSFTTNSLGQSTVSGIYDDTFDIHAGAWGYKTIALNKQHWTVTTTSVIIKIGRGYYDDFFFDFGWTKSGTVTGGKWVRTKPFGSSFSGKILNPYNDVPDDFGNACYQTGSGNNNQGVANGTTILTSPAFDLTGYNNPYIQYNKWLSDISFDASPPHDSLIVSLSGGGTNKIIDILTPSRDSLLSKWVFKKIKVKDFLPLTTDMHIVFSTHQNDTAHNAVIAAMDKFEIVDTLATSLINVNAGKTILEISPNPFSTTLVVNYSLSSEPLNTEIAVGDVTGRILIRHSVNNSGALQLNEKLVPGIYFISIIADGKTLQTIKVVKL